MKKIVIVVLLIFLTSIALYAKSKAKGFEATVGTTMDPLGISSGNGPKGFDNARASDDLARYFPWFSKPLAKTEFDSDIREVSKLLQDPPKRIEIPKIVSRGNSLPEMIIADDVDGVKQYVAQNPGSAINADDKGVTPLHLAADFGAFNVAVYLISDEKAPLNVVNNDGESPIDRLALSKDLSYNQARMFKLFIMNRSKKPSVTDTYDYLYFVWPGDNYRTRFSYSQTPLHLAADRRQTGLVRLFLEAGSSVTDINRGGKIPLHLAVRSGSFDSVKLLLEYGSDINTKDANDNLAINEAFFLPKTPSIAMINLLISNGSDVNTPNIYNNTPLILCAVWNADSTIAQIFLDAGADINAVNDIGNTSLHEAIIRDNRELATFLTGRENVNISIRNNKDETPLTILMKGKIEKIKWFADKMNNPNLADDDGNTPLHLAAELGSSGEVVDFFVSRGANVNLKNEGGNTPLMVAIEKNSGTTALALIKNNANLYEKNRSGTVLMYQLLEDTEIKALEQMLDVYEGKELPIDSNKNGPLVYAIETDKLATVEYIAKKFPSEIERTNDKSETVLHVAAKNSNHKVVKILASLTSDINKKDSNGESALHVAIRSGSVESAKNLLEAGADVNLANLQDQAPIVLAMELGNKEIFNILLDSSDIDLAIKNRLGDTPLHVAVRLNNQYAVETLLEKGSDVSVKNNEGSDAKALAQKIGSEALVAIL